MPLSPGFTLLELLVSLAIGLPILFAGMAFFRGQSHAYVRGEQHMELARETALVARVLYTEIKNIHAPMQLDERLDLWVDGEADGRPVPNQVVVEPGGGALHYWAFPLGQPGTRQKRRLSREGGSLVLEAGSERRRVGRRLTSLAFKPVPGDPEALRVEFGVEVPSKPGTPPLTESASLVLKLEGALNVVR